MRKLQVVVPFFIAGFGTCFAGLILDHVQHWQVYEQVDELFLLLPAMLGLKGNLQMTLASRFSTYSHLGLIQTKEDLLRLTYANLSLNQCLSIVVILISATLVSIIHYVTTDWISLEHSLLIISTALLTSSVTSFILDSVMIIVVQISAFFSINPDNIATPIAASLGDLTALTLCSFVSSWFWSTRKQPAFYWICPLILIFYILLIPILIDITKDHNHTRLILTRSSHWFPILTAMIISTISGLILKTAVSKSDDIALFLPIICGVSGNLVAVQASRLATMLHRNEERGSLPEGEAICMNPVHILNSTQPGFSITRLLMILVIPGQIVFYFFCILVNPRRSNPSGTFLALFLLGSEIQVATLIYLTYVLTFLLWSLEVDPDNSTIPYLTSISDVLGACIISLICLVVMPPPS